jgi:hypothetical protein
MNAFEIIVFVVTAVGVVAAFVGPLRFDRAFASLGRTGLWIDHPDDRAPEERAADEERDAPIPRRPLRSRAW